jgi:hypothetical protein
MNRHKHADLIHAWADGAEIQTNDIGEWRDLVEATYIFNPHFDYRIKPKEPEWWETIPAQGVLCWVGDNKPFVETTKIINIIKMREVDQFLSTRGARWDYAIPLTNEEIEAFKR